MYGFDLPEENLSLRVQHLYNDIISKMSVKIPLSKRQTEEYQTLLTVEEGGIFRLVFKSQAPLEVGILAAFTSLLGGGMKLRGLLRAVCRIVNID